jgi:hypothetical protein
MARETPSFPHRRNKDGSYDSICPTCYITVARSRQEADLADRESAHICHSAFLAERGLFTPTKSPHRSAA